MHERVVEATALFFYHRSLTVKAALISAEYQDGREEDPDEQVIFRNEQSDEDSYAGPEHNETNGFSHDNRPYYLRILILLYAAGQKIEKNKILFHFCRISGIIVNNYVS